MATAPIFIGSWDTQITSMVAAHSTTVALLIWQGGSSGSRVHAISLAVEDSAANTAILYYAERMTLESAMGTGAHVDDGDTITRVSGSFVTDGWLAGDRFVVSGSTTLLNGFFATLTTVAALTLTFATGNTNASEDFPSGAIIWRLSQLHLTTMSAQAGNAASTDALDMLITDFPPADVSPDRYLTLGPNDGLALSVGTAIGASTDRLDITVFGGDY
jgi:hypothetical protein